MATQLRGRGKSKQKKPEYNKLLANILNLSSYFGVRAPLSHSSGSETNASLNDPKVHAKRDKTIAAEESNLRESSAAREEVKRNAISLKH